MMKKKYSSIVISFIIICILLPKQHACAGFYTVSPYLSFADSPFVWRQL